MVDKQSGANESAQLEAKHKKFLSKLEASLEKENFTQEQKDEILEIANNATPGDKESLDRISKLYQKFKDGKKESVQSGANESAFERITESSDFEEFVVFAKAIQIIPSEIDLEELSEHEQADIVSRFKQWIKKGKPAAINPLSDEEPEKIIRVTRVKAYGMQKLTAVIKGNPIPMGVEFVPVYRKYIHNGKEVQDKTTVLSTTKKYTIDYTEKLARELVERCRHEAETLQLTFKEGGRTRYINNTEDFFGDFDKIMKAKE